MQLSSYTNRIWHLTSNFITFNPESFRNLYSNFSINITKIVQNPGGMCVSPVEAGWHRQCDWQMMRKWFLCQPAYKGDKKLWQVLHFLLYMNTFQVSYKSNTNIKQNKKTVTTWSGWRVQCLLFSSIKAVFKTLVTWLLFSESSPEILWYKLEEYYIQTSTHIHMQTSRYILIFIKTEQSFSTGSTINTVSVLISWSY